jgi:hypothetical protein
VCRRADRDGKRDDEPVIAVDQGEFAQHEASGVREPGVDGADVDRRILARLRGFAPKNADFTIF